LTGEHRRKRSIHANDGAVWCGIMRCMETVVRERRRFFERPEEPRAMRVTPRDIALLENIGRLRLASTAQLAALDGGSAQNVSRALLALWENAYVERPEAQAASRVLYEGSRPAIYGLTRKGAALLRRYGHDVRRRLLDGIDKGRDARWRFVEHTVSIAEFMVRLELAAQQRDDIRVLERGVILEDAPKTTRDRLVKLEATIRMGGHLRKNAVIPDALFGLRFNDDEESYFMLEIDRGEMLVERYKNAHDAGEKQYYLAKLPAKTDLRTLAATIKARWICEQAHQQLKEELGLDRFEGRSWQCRDQC
jgi:hypothetical protein